ncbi:hypothetical protein ACSBR2_001846 [Camellia fascicularis]
MVMRDDGSSGCDLGFYWWPVMAIVVDHDLGYSSGRSRSKVRVSEEGEEDEEEEDERRRRI